MHRQNFPVGRQKKNNFKSRLAIGHRTNEPLYTNLNENLSIFFAF